MRFFLKEINYTVVIYDFWKNKTKRISSIPDSNRYTREFSV